MRDGAVAELVLDAPPLNLLPADALDALEDALVAVEEEPPRALLVRADGDVFSAGVDVRVFDGLDAASAAALNGRLLALTHRVEALPLPTLAVVHGLCLTAAFELSLACDLLWAGAGVQFGLVEQVIGITPLMGGTQRIAERAGSARARELVMTGGLYDAATLERWNVVNRVLPDKDQLMAKGMKFAHKLADGPTLAHGATKRIIRGVRKGGVEEADRVTPEQFAGLFASSDLQNAVASFLKDGPGNATFEGR
jgi:enoyl-CoA hydratase